MSYKVEFKANNTVYTSEGDTVFEALGNLPLNSLSLKTKSEVIVTNGKRRAEKALVLSQGRALLRNHLRRAGFANQLMALLQ